MTISQRDRHRAERWIRQTGGLAHVSPEAINLLSRRYAARYRTAVRFALPVSLLVLIGLQISMSVSGPSLGSPGWSRAFAPRELVAFAIVTAVRIVQAELIARREREMAESLPLRVTRSTAVSIRTMLGPVRSAFVPVAIVVEAALGLTVVCLDPGWLPLTYLGGLIGASALVAIGLRQASTRATIAVDADSLVLDERLRSEDAYTATTPLFLLMIATPFGAFTSANFDLLCMVAFALVGGLYMLGTLKRPWPSLGAPRPDLVSPLQPGGAG